MAPRPTHPTTDTFLETAANIVESGWSHKAWARTADGLPCDDQDKHAAKFCMLTGFRLAFNQLLDVAVRQPSPNDATPRQWRAYCKASDYITAVLKVRVPATDGDPIRFNDDYAKDGDDVAGMFRIAAACVRAQVPPSKTHLLRRAIDRYLMGMTPIVPSDNFP